MDLGKDEIILMMKEKQQIFNNLLCSHPKLRNARRLTMKQMKIVEVIYTKMELVDWFKQ